MLLICFLSFVIIGGDELSELWVVYLILSYEAKEDVVDKHDCRKGGENEDQPGEVAIRCFNVILGFLFQKIILISTPNDAF